MTWKSIAVCAAALTLASATPSPAEVVAVTLAPAEHPPATLTVLDQRGVEHVYTQADLERLPTYRMVTTTPWRPEPAAFEGILLSDLLGRHGLADMREIRVIAENEYTTTVEREVWTDTPLLIATRVDGIPHSRRARGPIQFVVEDIDHRRLGHVEERHFVWMASRIEPGR